MAGSVTDIEAASVKNHCLTSEDCLKSGNCDTINCDPCQYDNLQTTAEGYCYNCKEYLCKQCLKSHRKFGAFRNHHILTGDLGPERKMEYPQGQPLLHNSNLGTKKEQFIPLNHEFKRLGQCEDVQYSTCDCPQNKQIYAGNCHKNLKLIIHDNENKKMEFDGLKILNNERINAIKGVGQKCKAQLNVMREQMLEFFDILEKEVDSAELQHMSLNEDLIENMAIYTEAANNILSLGEHLQQNDQSSENLAVFDAESKPTNLNAEYCTVKESSCEKSTSEILTEVNMRIQNICNNMCENMSTDKDESAPDKKGKAQVDQCQEKPSSPQLSASTCIQNNLYTENERSFKNLKLRKKFLIPIKEEEEGIACNITDSVFLPNNQLVVCDFANSTVILLHEKNFRVIDKLQLETKPWGVALIDANKIAVTLPESKKLLYIIADSGKLIPAESLSLHGVCWGICVHDRNLIITYQDTSTAYIEVRKLDGKMVKSFTITTKVTSESYFYVSSHQVKDNAHIYVSNGKSTLSCYTFEGQLLSKFKHYAIQEPRKVLVDDNGDCIVCSSRKMKLVCVLDLRNTQNLWKGDDIFKIWTKQCRHPQMMSMRWNDLTLVVGHESKNHIQVIKLKPNKKK